jgi:hypothetical protein
MTITTIAPWESPAGSMSLPSLFALHGPTAQSTSPSSAAASPACHARSRSRKAACVYASTKARTIASGASGRNGGFALRAPRCPMTYDRARVTLGPERAAALWRLTERTLDRMEGLAGGALRRVGSLRLAADEKETDVLLAEHAPLRNDGLAVEWMDASSCSIRGASPNPAAPGRARSRRSARARTSCPPCPRRGQTSPCPEPSPCPPPFRRAAGSGPAPRRYRRPRST